MRVIKAIMKTNRGAVIAEYTIAAILITVPILLFMSKYIVPAIAEYFELMQFWARCM